MFVPQEVLRYKSDGVYPLVIINTTIILIPGTQQGTVPCSVLTFRYDNIDL
jgi:hypothetical protein